MTWPDADSLNELHLPKTRLVVRDEVLYRMGDGKTPIAQFAFSEIQDVATATSYQFAFPAIGFAGSLGLAWACYQFVSSDFLSWAGTIVCVLMAAFWLLTIKTELIVIRTTDGEVKYAVTDPDADAEGFVLSLNRMRQRA